MPGCRRTSSCGHLVPLTFAQLLRRSLETDAAGAAPSRDLLQAVRPYGNPMEQDMIDMAQTLMEGQTPMEQLRRFLTPEQQSRFETMEMIMTAMQAMS